MSTYGDTGADKNILNLDGTHCVRPCVVVHACVRVESLSVSVLSRKRVSMMPIRLDCKHQKEKLESAHSSPMKGILKNSTKVIFP